MTSDQKIRHGNRRRHDRHARDRIFASLDPVFDLLPEKVAQGEEDANDRRCADNVDRQKQLERRANDAGGEIERAAKSHHEPRDEKHFLPVPT